MMRAVHIDHIWRKKQARWFERDFPTPAVTDIPRMPLVHGSISSVMGFSMFVHDPVEESLQRQALRRRALMKRANRRRARRQRGQG